MIRVVLALLVLGCGARTDLFEIWREVTYQLP